MDVLINFLVIFVASGITGVLSYMQSTKKGAAENESLQHTVSNQRQQIQRLEETVTNTNAVVEDQRLQIKRLNHFEELYTTLKEAHDGLKRDHDELKEKFEARDTAVQALKTDLTEKNSRVQDLEKQNHELFEANKQLAARVRAYEDFARLLGQTLAGAANRNEPGEAKDVLEPESTEPSSKETTNNDPE